MLDVLRLSYGYVSAAPLDFEVQIGDFFLNQLYAFVCTIHLYRGVLLNLDVRAAVGIYDHVRSEAVGQLGVFVIVNHSRLEV